jgi:hypothetical protein
MNRFASYLAASLSLAAAAHAAPNTMGYQGRLLDSDGAPLNSPATVRIALHTHPTNATEVWFEEHSVAPESGYFHVDLGASTALAPVLATYGSLWVETSVGGTPLGPRSALNAAPYAIHDSLSALDCNDGDTIRYNGTSGSWECQPDKGRLVYSHFEYDSTDRAFGTGWADGRTWSAHTLPGNTVVQVVSHIPQRNDNAGWNGCYTEYQVQINGGSWVSLGDTGYDAMDNSGATIQSSTYSFLYDPGQSSTYTLRLKTRHQSYAGTCWINENHGIGTTGIGVGWSNVTLLAFTK